MEKSTTVGAMFFHHLLLIAEYVSTKPNAYFAILFHWGDDEMENVLNIVHARGSPCLEPNMETGHDNIVDILREAIIERDIRNSWRRLRGCFSIGYSGRPQKMIAMDRDEGELEECGLLICETAIDLALGDWRSVQRAIGKSSQLHRLQVRFHSQIAVGQVN